MHAAAGSIVALVSLGLLPILWFTAAPAAAYAVVALLLAVTLGWAASGFAYAVGNDVARWIARGFLVLVIGSFVWAAMT